MIPLRAACGRPTAHGLNLAALREQAGGDGNPGGGTPGPQRRPR